MPSREQRPPFFEGQSGIDAGLADELVNARMPSV